MLHAYQYIFMCNHRFFFVVVDAQNGKINRSHPSDYSYVSWLTKNSYRTF